MKTWMRGLSPRKTMLNCIAGAINTFTSKPKFPRTALRESGGDGKMLGSFASFRVGH
jgi:hypothetical protein